MQLTSDSVQNGEPIPEQFAFGKFHPADRMALSNNRNPQLAWGDAPDNTKSFALLCVDPDVPADRSNFNQSDKKLTVDLKRVDFYHWAMAGIPADCHEIEAGACSDGVKPGGKSDPPGPAGSRQGLNDFSGFFPAGDDMAGEYFGYDGPCPPWNDEALHHYHFKLFALDVERLPVDAKFTGADLLEAMQGHVLAQAELIGTYSLNPEVKDTKPDNFLSPDERREGKSDS